MASRASWRSSNTCNPNHLAASERPERKVGGLNRRTAGASNLTLTDCCKNLVPRVDQPHDFVINFAESGEPVAPGFPHTFLSVIDRLRGEDRPAGIRQVPDDVLGVER